MIGKPLHLKLTNGATACGIIGVAYAAHDPRETDCLRCRRTRIYKIKMYGRDNMKRNNLSDTFTCSNCKTWVEGNCPNVMCEDCEDYDLISTEALAEERGEND